MFDNATIQCDNNTKWYDANKVIDREYSDGIITTITNTNNTITAKAINNENSVINNDFVDYFNGKYLYKNIQYTYTDSSDTDSSEFKVDPFSELIYTNNLLLMLI